MEWTAEKLCTTHEDYDLLVERFKHNYHCDSSGHTWKWRVIRSGIVISQGTSEDMAAAQKLAEANIPLNS